MVLGYIATTRFFEGTVVLVMNGTLQTHPELQFSRFAGHLSRPAWGLRRSSPRKRGLSLPPDLHTLSGGVPDLS